MKIIQLVILAIKSFFMPVKDLYEYLTNSPPSSFTIDRDGLVLIDKLKQITDSPNRCSTIKKAIALLEMACDADINGNVVAMLDKDGVVLTTINIR